MSSAIARFDRNADDFELERRDLETYNETIVHRVLGAILVFAFAGHVINYFFHWAPFESKPRLLVFQAASIVLCFVVTRHFEGNPPYHPLRKYIVAAVDFSVFAGIYVLLADVLPPMWLFALPSSLGMLLVSLSTLRYSTGVVLWMGLLTMVLHISMSMHLSGGYLVAILLLGGSSLGVVTGITMYVVHGLIRLHRDALWKERLSRFLAPELVNELARRPELLERQTERRVVTVLFVDIHGFTAMSERLPPLEVVEMLNLFLDEMTAAILNHHGLIDKYIGDAVMGVFGWPVQQKDHARAALKTAREMRARLRGLNLALERRGRPRLAFGIGIDTGEVLAGAFGSTHRLELTVIGDAANVASRLAALTRERRVDLLLSGATHAAAGDGFALRALGDVNVRGREQALSIFTLGDGA